MSHIVTIQTEIRDITSITAACRRLGLAEPVHRTIQLFSGLQTGWVIELPGWRYPAVCHVESGQLAYDNYEGRWGSPAELDHFRQAYAVERAKLEARRKGHTVLEHPLADGSIKLTVQIGGAA